MTLFRVTPTKSQKHKTDYSILVIALSTLVVILLTLLFIVLRKRRLIRADTYEMDSIQSTENL